MTGNWYGSIDYLEGLKVQETKIQQVLSTKQSFVIGCEHPPVITLGLRGDSHRDVHQEKLHEIRKKGPLSLVHTSRGGQATLHSPGQLVIYPIVPLRELKISVREYMYLLEETTLDFLRFMGISAQRNSVEPGLETPQGKIVAFGLRISKGISSHGLAINVNNDLSLFQSIRSCGVMLRNHDQVSNYCKKPCLENLFYQWLSCFSRNRPWDELDWTPPDTGDIEITQILEDD